ncbi:MAG: hypothetical protein AAFR66_13790, partial [Bacteroidota bacterium]
PAKSSSLSKRETLFGIKNELIASYTSFINLSVELVTSLAIISLFERELDLAGYYWNEEDFYATEYYLISALKSLPSSDSFDVNHGYIFNVLAKVNYELDKYPEAIGFYKEAWKIWSDEYQSLYIGSQYYLNQLLNLPSSLDLEKYLGETRKMPTSEIPDMIFINEEGVSRAKEAESTGKRFELPLFKKPIEVPLRRIDDPTRLFSPKTNTPTSKNN